MKTPVQADIPGYGTVPMGTDLLFVCQEMPELKVAAELCEDLWAPDPPVWDMPWRERL